MRGLAPRTGVASRLQSNSRPCRRSELAMLSSNDPRQNLCEMYINIDINRFYNKYRNPSRIPSLNIKYYSNNAVILDINETVGI